MVNSFTILMLSLVYLIFYVWEFFALNQWEPMEDPLDALYTFYYN